MKLHRDFLYNIIIEKNYDLRSNKLKKLIVAGGIISLSSMMLLSFSTQNNNKAINTVVLENHDNTYNNSINSYNSVNQKVTTIHQYDVKPRIITIHQEEIINDDTVLRTKVLLQKYTDIYGLKFDIVFEKAKELTNNFSCDDFKNNNNITGTKILKTERSYSSLELGVLAFVRNIYQIPSDFNLAKEDIIDIYNNYQMTDKYEAKVKYYCELFGDLEPELCMAIIYSESGKNLDTDAFLNKNNPAGLMNSSGEELSVFKNKEVGLIEAVSILNYQYMVDKKLQKKKTEEVISTIKSSYAPNGVSNDPYSLNENWTSNVSYFYKHLKNNPDIFVNKEYIKR